MQTRTHTYYLLLSARPTVIRLREREGKGGYEGERERERRKEGRNDKVYSIYTLLKSSVSDDLIHFL